MNKTCLLLWCLLPSSLAAQDVSRYLEGAVPEKDGRVVFTREVAAPGLSRAALFARVEEMAGKRFAGEGDERAGTIYANADEGVVICHGREYLVFVQKALVLDRALVDYQVTYTCDDGKCTMEVARVRYLYGEESPVRYLAEEWITDKHAYDKKRGRLLRGNDKFRVKTIDLVDGLESLLAETARGGGVMLPSLVSSPSAGVPSREGYRRVLPVEMDGNFINMLLNGSLLLSGEGEGSVTRWGGIGYLFDRPVVYCFADPGATPGTTYTLTWSATGQWPGFYREVIFECRALFSRQLAPGDLAAGELKNVHPLPCLHAGEIVAAWVK
ncbi:MAG: DUF4468 domain-containing protein [Odoribacteraceae bacterium]|nr:DUF4468 domain-containing protein [Odoribacteraceae bacterium]